MPNQTPRARPDMRDDLRFPDSWLPLVVERRFTAEEYELLSAGHIDGDMDDHWFIYLLDDTLFFHRSWTGICTYKVRLAKEGSVHSIVEAGEAEYRSMPRGEEARDHDGCVAVLNLVIDIVLLGKPDPLLESILRKPTQ